MPEIKHSFIKGKMNKDLDERLIPNGEYRDALNIQVSTSEGSDVGTAQNILGNSLILGQDFIGENAVCVGSIADEKNDKLYYFIVNNEELIVNGGFDGGFSGWNFTGATPFEYENGYIKGVGVSLYGKINQYIPTNKFIVGREYEISFTVSNYVEGYLKVNLYNENGDGIIIPTFVPENKTYTFIKKVNASITSNTGYYSRFWIQSYSSNVGFTGNIDNISIKPKDSTIIEYDSTTNTITPVLVDTVGDVLKFNPDNIITGINIIDDLLFWTDNQNEPKKININRCKKGTDLSGTIRTNFINDKRNDSFEAIKEEHITVIKKAPKHAPTIELISERLSGGTYSGVMRIIAPPNIPFTEQGGSADQLDGTPGDGGNYFNNSSMWIDDNSSLNHYYDFTSLTVGKQFDTQIETKLDGTSGFTLDWEVGDTIVFKAFEGDNYDEVPGTPITDYQVKARILSDSPYPILTDEISEIALNGSLSFPNANGNKPRYYHYTDTGIVYVPSLGRLECAGVAVEQKITSLYTHDFNTGDIYTVSITVSDHTQGRIGVRLFDAASQYWADGFRNPSGAGLHTHTFIVDTSVNANAVFGSYANKFHIELDDVGNNGIGFEGNIESFSVIRPAQNAAVRCEVLAINNPPLAPEAFGELRFAVDRLDTQEKLFEFKFPRFAYRYQYEDREYSTMSPFSQIAFLPGSFDYHPKKGYNLGMTNRVTSIGIKEFVTNVPDGVIAIDILYKDEASPSIYIVDTIKPKHNPLTGSPTGLTGVVWDDNEFVVTSEQISQMLPSNQLLRPWDAVPRKALAQEISGNRIIYGNYTQGFDLKVGDVNALEEYNPDFDFSIFSNSNTSLNPKKSIKSLREYQLGVVFVDEHGRETPVISNSSGTRKLDKLEAEKVNQIQVNFNNNKYPENMKYFKFFIKETSGEYYNLAMDRYYDAEDGQVWLSFPSSDRDKLDIDTFLILKKGIESNDMVTAEAKYKVLDIQNEAPDFIKQDKQLIEEKAHVFADSNVFEDGLVDVPLAGKNSFKMNYDQFIDGPGSSLHEIKDSNLYVEFSNSNNNVSNRYRISKITTDYIDGVAGAAIGVAKYSVKLDKKLGDDVNFITDDVSGLSPTKINDLTVVNIYKYTKENSSKFDGRFFVKINAESTFEENTVAAQSADVKYRTVLSKKLYYLSSENTNLHRSELTGQDRGVYNNSFDPQGSGSFGSFAPFFRNYNWETQNGDHAEVYDTGDPVDIGQYYFGFTHTQAAKELAWITTAPLVDGFLRSNGSGNLANTSISWPGVKIADKGGEYALNSFGNGAGYWTQEERYGVFNPAGEQIKGDVWFIDGGPYAFTTPNDNLDWGDADNAGGIASGMTDGTIDIGMGGIWDSTVVDSTGTPSTPNNIPGFYNIGKSGLSTATHNPNYIASSTENLVNKFYPGQKFRFKEDPSGEVYTIQPGITQSRRLRWQTDGNFNNDHSGQLQEADFMSNSIQLSPNFSKNWIPTFVNSSGDSVVNWNPTGSTGPIANGLQLKIDHSSSANQWDGTGFPYVGVDNIIGTDANGLGAYAITTGMILTSHSDGGTANEYTGASSKEYLAVSKITGPDTNNKYQIHLTGYSKMLVRGTTVLGIAEHDIFSNAPDAGDEMIFEQPKMNGYSQYSVNRLNAQDAVSGSYNLQDPGIIAIGYTLEFVEPIDSESLMPSNPAIWETEPKESTPLDVYYEASGCNPFTLTEETKYTTIPVGSLVECVEHPPATLIDMQVTAVDNAPLPSTLALGQLGTGPWRLSLATKQILDEPIVGGAYIQIDDHLKITKPDGSTITVTVTGWDASANWTGQNNNYPIRTPHIYIDSNLYGTATKYGLNWHNCFSFGNGIESNRIRDNFNLPYVSNGVKVSTTLDEGHGEEHRKYGLIYSGIYNSNSSINNLNQFIAAEKITKDINPIYGSIQKLHSRDSDLVTLCEDKCLRILANKDAVFNADGNPQLTANDRVLGQTIPFSGEYGISKNPESFASESYRVYFTDKARGAVMRLSRDGLTPISDHGMKDWFKDNLKISNKIIGSHDDKKEEYNVTLTIAPGYLPNNPSTTVSFKEDVRGWVSFKSFVPEQGISMASDYYTMLQGRLYKHHNESVDRNTFYTEILGEESFSNSSINVVLNDGPGSIKSFHTLCYEGSQADIEIPLNINGTPINDGEYYNLTGKFGWFVSSIETNKQIGSLFEFIEKEGKWFNYIKGVDSDITSETDFGAFNIQGIGSTAIDGVIINNNTQTMLRTIGFNSKINSSLQIGDILYRDNVYTASGGFQTIDPTNFDNLGTIVHVGTWKDFIPAYDESIWEEVGPIWQYFDSGLEISMSSNPGLYKEIIIADTVPINLFSSTNNYYFFTKNHIVNTSSLLGYYADVKFENNSIEKAELFAVSSEITESSK